MGERNTDSNVSGRVASCSDSNSFILSGNAVLCPDSKYLFVSNLVDGIDQYSFPSLERVQKFTHSIIHNVPLQVAIVQNASFIVSGGDDGAVRIFERRNGQLLTRLQHGGEKQLVQTVAVSPLTAFPVFDLTRQ
jgi:hypothetical protein